MVPADMAAGNQTRDPQMKKNSALYVVKVWNKGKAGNLVLNFTDQNEAQKAVFELDRRGLRTDFFAHGYTIYRNAEDAVYAAAQHRWD